MSVFLLPAFVVGRVGRRRQHMPSSSQRGYSAEVGLIVSYHRDTLRPLFFSDVIPNRPAVGRVRNLLWFLFTMSSRPP